MKNWSNDKLLDSTRALVCEERRITLEIIRHLSEIRRRRLYAERGFNSMWEFLTAELKYSEPAAQQRLAVMRLLEEAPEAEKWLESGRISFSSFAEVARVKKSSDAPISELLALVLDRSFRDAKKALSGKLGKKNYNETISQLPGGITEVRLILEPQEAEQLEKLKALKSHERPKFRMGKHFARWVSEELKRLAPGSDQKTSKVTNPYSAHVPKHIRDAVWKRDGGVCTYTDPISGRRCTSAAFLQLDHVVPRARGGRNDLENLRLLCREHNLLAAADVFGADFLETFRH